MARTINNTEFEVCYAIPATIGYGHKHILVGLTFNGHNKRFSAVTTNMPGFDEANELEGQEKIEALYDLIENKISDRVAEWISDINN